MIGNWIKRGSKKSSFDQAIKITKVAALMSEIKVEVRFDKATLNYIPNTVLGEVIGEYLEEVGFPHKDGPFIENPQKK
ncbi:hypothetical protein ABEP00_18910 [Heyndrickxia sporothermodurans]|uniref:amidohydrolase n=1 Tax=Heyndrickxia TaxID=2837504 RepID=UPI0011589C21|nr:amidohydrolase [Heyndrickxia sporothermodurans]